jgi:GTP-binding protein EngB required for normal cell division
LVDMPDSYVVFTGRPNSGKSTTIRALTGLKVTAGKRPGTTTSIDKYQIAQDLYLVDMPGYGRKVDASRRWEDETKDRILDFIEDEAKSIVLAVHVVNITTFLETEARLARKGIMSLDVEMVGYLHDTLGEFPLVAANKIDKGREGEVAANLEAFLDRITGGAPSEAAGYVFPVSVKYGVGVGPLKDCFVKALVAKGFRNPFEYIR